MKRTLITTVIVTTFALSLAAPSQASAAPTLAAPASYAVLGDVSTSALATKTVTIRLRAAIQSLSVARELPAGYDRDKFGDWVDADRDCRDTRAEVLVAESRRAVTGGCLITRGEWHSYYDKRVWRLAGDVDVDHMVPLSEAWKSGARRWTSGTRSRYANDLGDGRPLVAVTDNVNQSKGDSDPAEWLPQYGRCLYVKQYAAVKVRWSLRVDSAEKQALARVASGCSNDVLRVRKAAITMSSSGGGDNGGLDPRFDYCYQATAKGYGPYHRGRDPEYAWYTDADNDGVVCE